MIASKNCSSLREIHDIALWDPGDTNLLGVRRQQPEDLAGKLQKGPQGIQDAGDPGLPTAALLCLPPEAQEMSHIEGCHGLISYIPDHPPERLSVARDRRRRAPHFVARPFQKRGTIIPMVRGGVRSSPPDIGFQLIRIEGTLASEVIGCLKAVIEPGLHKRARAKICLAWQRMVDMLPLACSAVESDSWHAPWEERNRSNSSERFDRRRSTVESLARERPS
jgi:hypothetical protein